MGHISHLLQESTVLCAERIFEEHMAVPLPELRTATVCASRTVSTALHCRAKKTVRSNTVPRVQHVTLRCVYTVMVRTLVRSKMKGAGESRHLKGL